MLEDRPARRSVSEGRRSELLLEREEEDEEGASSRRTMRKWKQAALPVEVEMMDVEVPLETVRSSVTIVRMMRVAGVVVTVSTAVAGVTSFSTVSVKNEVGGVNVSKMVLVAGAARRASRRSVSWERKRLVHRGGGGEGRTRRRSR